MSDHSSPDKIPPPNTYVHAFARWCIRPLVHTPVTPNHLTALRLISGLAAATVFAIGGYFWAVWGGILFVISALLDRADGELARLSGRMSPGGHRFDLYSDMLVNILVFIGIGFGLSGELPGIWAPVLGIIAGLAVGGIFLVVLGLHRQGSHPGVAFNYPSGFDLDDTLFIIALFAWFDILLPLLFAAAIGAPAFLVFAIWRSRQMKAQS